MLAVDPGRLKCGLVVGRRGSLLARAVVSTEQVPHTVGAWAREYGVTHIVIGGGTGSGALRAALAAIPGLPTPEIVREAGTTLEARRRYFRDHPPRGWRRLLPLSLQVPPEDYDDYVAELLLERVLGGRTDAGPER